MLNIIGMGDFVILDKVMQKKVVTITKDRPLIEACNIMIKKNIGCIVVVSRRDPHKVLGIFTERDLLRIVTIVKHIHNLTVADVMTSPVDGLDIPKVISRHPYITLIKISELMEKKGFRRVPIIVRGKLIGIITETDVTRLFKKIVKKHIYDLFSVGDK